MGRPAYQNPALPPQQRAQDLLGHLTLREKVGQLNQRLYGFACYHRNGDDFTLTDECLAEIAHWGGLGVLYGLYRADPWAQRDETNGVPPRLAARVYNLVQRAVLQQSRFGIPALMSSECPHGHQALGGYLLPPALAMGASFNPALVQSAFAVCGGQLRRQRVDLALVSVLDVLRDPRWGRSEECFGEDTQLCAAMAAAAVGGLRSAGVDVVAKHLCAQGETTGGVNGSSARIGPRELAEIHLPPVAAACAAGAAGFMAAYNDIDGTPCHANPALLREYLRGPLGFSGLVMADGTALDRLDAMSGGSVQSAALALESGVDVSLWDAAFPLLEQAVQQGLVSEARVDEAVLRVLTLKFARGLFEQPFLEEEATAAAPGYTPEEAPQSLELARQSAVLLKNENNLLPLAAGPGTTLALVGPGGDALATQLGDYAPPIPPQEGETLLQGLQRLAAGPVLYAPGSSVLRGSPEALAAAVDAACQADVVVLALGGSSSRFGGARFDVNGAAIPDGELEMDCGEGVDAADLRLPACQRQLAAAIFATGKPVVAVVMAGRPYAIADIAAGANALVFAFYPGPWGGRALAEVLLGVTPPGGRLPASLPRAPGQIPCYHNPLAGYRAMRYYDTAPGPLYSFGAGLSTTGFSYGDFVQGEGPQGEACLTFTITNTGGRPGWAVPMLYCRRAQTTRRPRSRLLCGFKRVLLAPGESRRLELPAVVYTEKGAEALGPAAIGSLWLEENAHPVWPASE